AKITLQSTDQQENKQYKDALNKAEGKTSPFYIAMDAEPANQNWFEVKYEEVFDNRPNLWYYGEGNWFELRATQKLNLPTFYIYDNGKIEKRIPKTIEEKYKKKYQYLFIDKKKNEHDLGIFKYKTIKNKYGVLYGGKTVDLINIDQLENYKSDDGKTKFEIKINSSRKYLNSKTLASLLGAMLSCGHKDFVFNGFSHSNGGSKPSVSHKNGYNGDFRYLRYNKKGGKTDLSVDNKSIGWKGLDEIRQNKFHDELFKFGWKSMISQYYGERNEKGESTKLLNHCKNDKKNNHNDHLHIQSYKPDYTEVKE
ncbi:hypothetical protein LVK02_14965, partial [Tenacibaculum maritimum]|nr:hypothetical protein [Tenacibaculum maritimum]